MEFAHSPKCWPCGSASSVHGGTRLPERAALCRRRRGQHGRRQALDCRRASSRSSSPRRARPACGTCSCRTRITAPEPDQPRIRAAVRSHGPRALGAGGLQLLRAGHRQHGDARALRHARAQGAVAASRCCRRDPLRLRDDRAGRGLVGRDQHRDAHRARWRRVRHQRPQVVDLRRRRSALQDLHRHGQDRSGRAAGTRSSR